MKELLPGTTGAFGRLVAAFLLPSIVAVGMWSFFVLPVVQDDGHLERLDTLTEAERLVVLAVSATAVAVVASLLGPIAHSLLAGYKWPARIRAWRKRAHLESRRKLESDVRSATNPADLGFWQASERLKFLPPDPEWTQPTTFGNRMTAAEMYGKSRFGLDSPMFIHELRGVVPERVASDLDSASNLVDAMVGSVTISTLFIAVSAAAGIVTGDAAPWIAAAVGLFLAGIGYVGAVFATRVYIGAMRGLVNLGREPLAAALGLELPSDLPGERSFWLDVTNYAYWGPGSPPWSGTPKRETAWARHRRAHRRKQRTD